MNQETVLTITQNAIVLTIMLAAPPLLISLIVGLLISVFQTVTQINEMTITFIPKALAVVAALVVFGPWMLNTLLSYTSALFNQLPQLAH